MEQIIAQLGPNQVTVPIEPSRYIQSTTLTKLTNKSTLPDPVKLFERLKYGRAPPLPPPPPSCPKPKPVSLEPYALFYRVLIETDPKVELLTSAQAFELISKFKLDLQKNLDNEKGFFKQFGFARKKTVSLEAMKVALDKKDSELTDDAITYMAKLLNKCITVYDLENQERVDNNPLETGETLLFTKNKESLYTFEGKYGSTAQVDDYFFKQLKSRKQLTTETVSKAKIAELRVWAKLCGLKRLVKKEIQDALTAKIDQL